MQPHRKIDACPDWCSSASRPAAPASHRRRTRKRPAEGPRHRRDRVRRHDPDPGPGARRRRRDDRPQGRPRCGHRAVPEGDAATGRAASERTIARMSGLHARSSGCCCRSCAGSSRCGCGRPCCPTDSAERLGCRPPGRLCAREAQRRRRGGARVRLPRALAAAAAGAALGSGAVLPASRVLPRAPRGILRPARRPAHARGAAHARERSRRPISPSMPTSCRSACSGAARPDRERSWFRLLVAEDWDIGGRFRKAAVAARQRTQPAGAVRRDAGRCSRRSAETRGLPASPRRLWRQLRAQFRNQRIATIGPDLSHRRTIVAQVLRTQIVREAVRDEMKAARASARRDALKVARGYAYEIAANYSHWFVTSSCRRARPAVEPALRRRRARQFLEPRVGRGRQRGRLRALPPQPHGLPAAVLRGVPQGLRGAAHRRRHQPEHAGDRFVPAPRRRVLPAPQLLRQRALLRPCS